MDQAKADIEQITSDPDGWGTEMIFTAPTSETATIYGLFTEHHNSINDQGISTNAKFSHCSFSERLLTALDYPTRDGNGEVSLLNHSIVIKGKEYIIREQMPDETVGFIACKLGDVE